MSLDAGTRLGPYEVLSHLGAGGMGEVYRARDTRLDRTVAIKVLSTPSTEDARRLERFRNEARAISRLSHPHICTLHDVGEQDGAFFLVMEHVQGRTLAERLEEGPLLLDELLRHGIQIAEALHVAHREGVVHRDLKPTNVMPTREGVKLLDFGLARLNKLSQERKQSPALQASSRKRAPDDAPLQLSPDGRFAYVRRGPQVPAEIDRVDLASGARTHWRTLSPRDAIGVMRFEPVVLVPDARTYCYAILASSPTSFSSKGCANPVSLLAGVGDG